MLVAGALFWVMMQGDLAYLHGLAHEVIDSCRVAPNAEIPGVGPNRTGFAVRVPGGTQSYYPAFWIRDAAMMLGSDLVPQEEVEGWIRVVAKTQPGPEGLTFPHGLVIPPFSIPDHITLAGAACWFPGAYADQGIGNYGFLPPADDAFYFVQMVHEQFRLTARQSLQMHVNTGWGDQALSDVAAKAFDSVEADPKTGLVVASSTPGQTRVDWGFCDSIHKAGLCLMPSLLRYQAARRLAEMFATLGDKEKTRRFQREAALVKGSILPTFYKPQRSKEGLLISATVLGRKEDVWAEAFAIWLGILPPQAETAMARHLASLYRAGGTMVDGQIRHVPPCGEYGGHWESASSEPESYQNGGYWATPTGWMVVALTKVDKALSERLLADYVRHLKEMRLKGAPYEWINPNTNTYQNANYGSSAGLVWVALQGNKP